MEWTSEIILRLRSLWDEGLSTAEIGRRLGISKNAVVGKAHRLGLAARPSPIHRTGERRPAPAPAPRLPRRVMGSTLPPLASPRTPPAPPAVVADLAAVSPAPAASALRPVALAGPARRQASCCWPIGEPGTKSFHFCDAEAMSGKPYCAEHVQLAYVKVRDRREEAA